jgi:hypothetical protein
VTVLEASNAVLVVPENSGWPFVNVEPFAGVVRVTDGVVAVTLIVPLAEHGSAVPPVSVTDTVAAVVVPLGLVTAPPRQKPDSAIVLETVTDWLDGNGFAHVIVAEFPAAACMITFPPLVLIESPSPSDHVPPENVKGPVAW